MKYILFSLLIVGLMVSTAVANPPYNNIQRVRVVDSYDVIQKTVQFDPRLFTETSGFYQVGEQLKAEKQTELENEVNLLRSQLDILIKILQAKNGVVPAPAENVPANPVEPAPNDIDEIDVQVLELFKQSCARCHNETKRDGDLQLVNNGRLVDVSLADSVLVHDRTNGVNLNDKSRMPKGAPPLSDEKVELLRQWVVSKAEKSKGE